MNELSDDVDDLEGFLEALDNLQHKNNIKLRGVKEEVEEGNLIGYLQGMFTDQLQISGETETSIELAFQVGVCSMN